MARHEHVLIQSPLQACLRLMQRLPRRLQLQAQPVSRRAKPTSPLGGKSSDAGTKQREKRPTLDSFLQSRDFAGASALLEFLMQSGSSEPGIQSEHDKRAWLAYTYFHQHDFAKSLQVMDSIMKSGKDDPALHLHAAACLFFLSSFSRAIEEAQAGPECGLKNRIMFHCAHRLGNEEMLAKYLVKLTDSVEDQLGLAAIHFLRSHFQEATEIYKRLLLEHREYLALQVYIAVCYYKLDYYDVALEILNPYLAVNPDSAIALSLKACCHFKLYDGKAAEQQLQAYIEKSQLKTTTGSMTNADTLINHNLVVFRNGENALKVLPPLVDIVPEARLNLCIHYLKVGDLKEAYKLMKDVPPQTPQEYILKGVTHAAYGQANQSTEDLHLAQQYFQLIGSSSSECDTIPGRQAMASCFFLLQQFEDVLIYLSSIQAYSVNDDRFHWNYGVALANVGRFAEAGQAFASIQNLARHKQYEFIAWSARVHIFLGQARQAWDMYLDMETSTDSFNLLLLIANDCYRVGAFYYAAKAFDVLWRLDPIPEYWEGKRGACCGVLQMVAAGKEKRSVLSEIINMLKNNTDTPQAQFIVRVMNKHWLESE